MKYKIKRRQGEGRQEGRRPLPQPVSLSVHPSLFCCFLLLCYYTIGREIGDSGGFSSPPPPTHTLWKMGDSLIFSNVYTFFVSMLYTIIKRTPKLLSEGLINFLWELKTSNFPWLNVDSSHNYVSRLDSWVFSVIWTPLAIRLVFRFLLDLSIFLLRPFTQESKTQPWFLLLDRIIGGGCVGCQLSQVLLLFLIISWHVSTNCGG